MEALRKKKISVCQGTLQEALKIDTDASLLMFLLLSRRPADESLLVYDSYLVFWNACVSPHFVLIGISSVMCISTNKIFSLREHRLCLSVLALPPDFICLNAIQHSCFESSTSLGDPEWAWLKDLSDIALYVYSFWVISLLFQGNRFRPETEHLYVSKNELDITDFSIAHAYSYYDLLQE